MVEMADDRKFDALVIGAGPAGGTAALILARAGLSVAVVERTVFPRRKVCGEYVSSTSFDLFEQLGLLDEYLSLAGPPVSRVGIFSDKYLLTAPMPSPGRRSHVWGRALQRDVLDAWILEKAVKAGAVLFQPYAADFIEGRAGEKITRLGSRENRESINVRSSFVIAAHGSWDAGELPTQPRKHDIKESDLLAFKTHFQKSSLDEDIMPLLVFPGGYGGMVHCGNGELSVSFCIRREMLTRLRSLSPGRKAADVVFDHVMNTTAGVRGSLTEAIHVEEWLAAGPIRPGFRKRYVNGVFTVGNAAGESHPAIAEGISMAMQSSWLLCESLGRTRMFNEANLTEIGSEYDRRWKHSFARRIKTANFFAYLALNRRGHSAMARVLGLFPSLLTAGAKLSGKVNRVVVNNCEIRPLPAA
jgi:flavin-dependent dehydrogenase